MKKTTILMLAGSVLLSACSQSNSETMGGVFGGIAGGVLGSQFGEGSGKTAATIGGALLGTWIGTSVARDMTRQDRVYYEQATTEAQQAPVGETITWNNPETGHQGTVTPTREGQTQSGQYCREFQQTVTIDGRTERAYGTACQQPDGSWKIVNQ